MKKQILTIFFLFFTLHLSAAQMQFSQQKLDQITAPIALYPDALLSQILMAATYPQEIKEAVLWSQSNGYPKGETALRRTRDKNWQPSVISLTAFPQVLRMMGQRPVWTQNLGDAFLADPDSVMDTIQKLRMRAKETGHLRSSQQQRVEIQYEDGVETITIEPASQDTVYVPIYNPIYVYGRWPHPSLMPFVYRPSHYHTQEGVYFSFGSGIILHAMLWSSFRWRHHDVAINVSRYNKAYNHRQIRSTKRAVSWRETMRSHHPRHLQHTALHHEKTLRYQQNLQYKREIQRKNKMKREKEIERQRKIQYQRRNTPHTIHKRSTHTPSNIQDHTRVKRVIRKEQTRPRTSSQNVHKHAKDTGYNSHQDSHNENGTRKRY